MALSIQEVYFLVRVGTWGETELENYIEEQAYQALRESQADVDYQNDMSYRQGEEAGWAEGFAEGKAEGFDDGYQRGCDDGYNDGLRDGGRD